jgi:hypothetical protein
MGKNLQKNKFMNLTPGQTLPSNQMNNQISNLQINYPQIGHLGQPQA